MNGLLSRLRRRRVVAEPELVDDGTLVVVAQSWDPAVADSAVLASIEPGTRAIVRHHLVLPGAAAVEQARHLLADERYAVEGRPDEHDATWRVVASRSQVLDAMEVAQQRSRMAGLAARLDGDVVGWDALSRG